VLNIVLNLDTNGCSLVVLEVKKLLKPHEIAIGVYLLIRGSRVRIPRGSPL